MFVSFIFDVLIHENIATSTMIFFSFLNRLLNQASRVFNTVPHSPGLRKIITIKLLVPIIKRIGEPIWDGWEGDESEVFGCFT